MPNHITNRIKLIGEPSEIRRVMEAVKVDKVGLGSLDFEKIIPMPADVDDSYNWCISNWGTKWNSYGYESIDNPDDSDTISFLTAWSAPHPVLEKLTTMFPSVTVEHEWADEDIGCNCGRRTYYDGERTEEYYPECDKESIEFAASVIGLQLEQDCGLYLNASETGYINNDYEEYEVIEFFGQPVLLIDERITDADIPKGLHSYHLRLDENRKFYAVEKRSTTGHSCSVITKEPIDLGDKGYLYFNEDTAIKYTDEFMSFLELRDHSPKQSEDEALDMQVTQ
ncbi:MAG: hypothetical protein IJ555_00115 [Ruminococcus sp.]|nr:hypothetical protein [Ruminococcus sp.]